QALPARSRARLLEVHPHRHAHVRTQGRCPAAQPARIVGRGLDVVDAARADDDEQPIVSSVENRVDLVAAADHGLRVVICQAWLGSTITGRWVSFLSTGIAWRSSVNRYAVSNVRIPRSHSMTASLPSFSTYSADISNSSRVLDRPRLSSTGLPERPASVSSE